METLETKTQSNDNGAPSAVESIEGNAGTVSEFKNKYPALCQRCGKQFTTFRSEGHPDDGKTFACGLMVETMDAGTPSMGCAHFILPVIGGNKAVCDGKCACGCIIDVDTVQRKTPLNAKARMTHEAITAIQRAHGIVARH